MKTFICHKCGTIFKDLPSKKRIYCSLKCSYQSFDRRKKLKIASTGKHHSEETKLKMSKAKIRELHPLFQKHRSKKTKIKMKTTVRKKTLIKNNTNRNINPVPVHAGEQKGGIRYITCSNYDDCLNIVVSLSTYMEDDLKTNDQWKKGFSCIECKSMEAK